MSNICEYEDCDEDGEFWKDSADNAIEVCACEDHEDWAFEESAFRTKQKYSLELVQEYKNEPKQYSLGGLLFYTFLSLSEQYKVYTIFINTKNYTQLYSDFREMFHFQELTEIWVHKPKDFSHVNFSYISQNLPNFHSGNFSVERMFIPKKLKEINPQLEVWLSDGINEPYAFFLKPLLKERKAYYARY